jgi:hypothetical protein
MLQEERLTVNDDPDRLRERAERYEQLATRMPDDQAVRALLELAQKDRMRADELSASTST